MPPPVTLPTATIQDDFTTVLSEVHAGITPSESIWLSCYKDGESSIHGKISASLHEKDRDRVELVGRGGVELTRTSQVSLFFPEWKNFIHSSVVPIVGPSVRPLISSPGAAGPRNCSSGTQPAVQDSGSILWISFLRGRYTLILYIRTRNV